MTKMIAYKLVEPDYSSLIDWVESRKYVVGATITRRPDQGPFAFCMSKNGCITFGNCSDDDSRPELNGKHIMECEITPSIETCQWYVQDGEILSKNVLVRDSDLGVILADSFTILREVPA